MSRNVAVSLEFFCNASKIAALASRYGDDRDGLNQPDIEFAGDDGGGDQTALGEGYDTCKLFRLPYPVIAAMGLTKQWDPGDGGITPARQTPVRASPRVGVPTRG